MKLEDIARECRSTYKGDKSGVPIVGLEHLIPQEMGHPQKSVAQASQNNTLTWWYMWDKFHTFAYGKVRSIFRIRPIGVPAAPGEHAL